MLCQLVLRIFLLLQCTKFSVREIVSAGKPIRARCQPGKGFVLVSFGPGSVNAAQVRGGCFNFRLALPIFMVAAFATIQLRFAC